MGEVVFCRYYEARRVLVYPVDYPRTPLTAHTREAVPAVPQQRVHKRPVRVPRRRVHHHPARFVDNYHVAVLVYDVQRDVLRLRLWELRLRQLHRVCLSALRAAVLFYRRAGKGHTSLFNQPLCRRTRQLGHNAREESVDTLAALLRSYLYKFTHLSENSARMSSSENSISPDEDFGAAFGAGLAACAGRGWGSEAGLAAWERGFWAGRGSAAVLVDGVSHSAKGFFGSMGLVGSTGRAGRAPLGRGVYSFTGMRVRSAGRACSRGFAAVC